MTQSVDVVGGGVDDEPLSTQGRIDSERCVGDGSNGAFLQVASVYARVLAEVVDASSVSMDAHFFDDLGVDSMVMAKFCARVRRCSSVPVVSMKDVYRFPTVESLATALIDGDGGSGSDASPDKTATPHSASMGLRGFCAWWWPARRCCEFFRPADHGQYRCAYDGFLPGRQGDVRGMWCSAVALFRGLFVSAGVGAFLRL